MSQIIETITIVNIYTLIIKAHKHIKQMLTDLKGDIDNTLILRNFKTPLSTMSRSSRWKINKEMLDFNYTLNQMDPTNIYRIFLPTAAEYTFS